MSNKFLTDIKNEMNNEKRLTENGAIGYRTVGNSLVDMNFKVASYRNKSNNEILNDFYGVFYENPINALRWLFFVRDIRNNGLGERRIFRICMKWLCIARTEFIINIIPFIHIFGRYDDIFALLGCDEDVDNAIFSYIKEQLNADILAMNNNKPISLMAKWLPSVNTSSKDTRKLAKIIIKGTHSSEKAYRKVLSQLRKYSDVLEVKISANEWDKVDYNTVPSIANIKYANAFYRHDGERRIQYLDDLANGKQNVKINANVLYPYNIVSSYTNGYHNVKKYDETLEQLWKNLPKKGINKNILVVADGSGSMTMNVNNKVSALDVANSLAIYMAENNKGGFANKYITFSNRPQIVDFNNATSLRDKIEIALSHCEIADTNIEATFNLILNTAINNNYTQYDMPETIVIISDMEFNSAIYGKVDKTLFENIADKYAEYGYKLPKLVFWNVASRTNVIPLTQNELGVALVSGFSTSIVDMVMSDNLNPEDVLYEAIYHPCYNIVEKWYNMCYNNDKK